MSFTLRDAVECVKEYNPEILIGSQRYKEFYHVLVLLDGPVIEYESDLNRNVIGILFCTEEDHRVYSFWTDNILSFVRILDFVDHSSSKLHHYNYWNLTLRNSANVADIVQFKLLEQL